MQVTRRQFLRFAGGASLILGTGYWGGSNSQNLNAQSTRLYSAATLENGLYALVSVELSTFPNAFSLCRFKVMMFYQYALMKY